MRVEVINTGTELLLGNVINTHLGYLGRQLFKLGLRIDRQTTVPDGLAIREILIEAIPRCEILLVTGGLGPTSDDLTREITAELLNRPLQESAEVMQAMEDLCRSRGVNFRESMKRQALVPEGAEVLPNACGTAPGLYFRPLTGQTGPHLFLLPGPPRELMPMFEASVWPVLDQLTGAATRPECRIYRVVGLGESAVEQMIGTELEAVSGFEVGYCARPNEVDLRLIGATSLLDQWDEKIRSVLGENLTTVGEVSLEAILVARLRDLGLTMATAESCTGGLLAHRVTNVSGSSAAFLQGYVTYANEAKMATLGVDADLLREHGAVSEPVARAMAEQALARSGADLALSTTGIAGPDGGTPDKPVGTVFIGLAQRGAETVVFPKKYPVSRVEFKNYVAQFALDALRRRLL